MPTLKEYNFQEMFNSNITLSIKANSFEEAYEVLTVVAKHPADFNFIK